MKIGLIGYGKMGQIIEALAIKQKHEIVLKINSSNTHLLTKNNLQKCDVCIEFTTPHTALKHIEACFKAGVPVVCGSTGWYDALPQLQKDNADAALFYASNFSVGVNLMFAVNDYMAKLFQGHTEYKVALQEIHHLQKLDKPSGTAISLANGILRNYQNFNGYTIIPQSDKLLIDCLRQEGVVGTHKVTYQSEIDELTLTHKANNRTGFAQGALLASTWIINRKGFFTMSDLLDLKLS